MFKIENRVNGNGNGKNYWWKIEYVIVVLKILAITKIRSSQNRSLFKSEQKLGDFIQQFWQISDVTLWDDVGSLDL